MAYCRVGVVFCGRQSPGGHNVVWGLYSAIKIHNPDNILLGFVGKHVQHHSLQSYLLLQVHLIMVTILSAYIPFSCNLQEYNNDRSRVTFYFYFFYSLFYGQKGLQAICYTTMGSLLLRSYLTAVDCLVLENSAGLSMALDRMCNNLFGKCDGSIWGQIATCLSFLIIQLMQWTY